MKQICFALLCALAGLISADQAAAQTGPGAFTRNQCELVRLRAGCVCKPGPRGEAVISCDSDGSGVSTPPPIVTDPVRPRPSQRSCAMIRLAAGCSCRDLPGGGVDVTCGLGPTPIQPAPQPISPFPPPTAQSCAAVTIPFGCFCRDLPGGGVDISCGQTTPTPQPPTLSGCARVLPPEGCQCRDTPHGPRITCAQARPPVWRPYQPYRPWRPHPPRPRPRPHGGGVWAPYTFWTQ